MKRSPRAETKDALYARTRWDVQGTAAIQPKLLDVFAYEYPGKKILVRVEAEEFSAVCPWSGLPDFGRLLLEYVPAAQILELKSFKYYLQTFRNVGIYEEHAVNRIFDDLSRLLRPKYLKLTLVYNTRGGMITTAERETGKKPSR